MSMKAEIMQTVQMNLFLNSVVGGKVGSMGGLKESLNRLPVFLESLSNSDEYPPNIPASDEVGSFSVLFTFFGSSDDIVIRVDLD